MGLLENCCQKSPQKLDMLLLIQLHSWGSLAFTLTDHRHICFYLLLKTLRTDQVGGEVRFRRGQQVSRDGHDTLLGHHPHVPAVPGRGVSLLWSVIHLSFHSL